jgi:SAM-dependent methyltransferase
MGATTARYDGHADWYDRWAGADAGGFMAHAQAALAELLPPGPGTAVDVGCGTGLHAAVLAARRFRVLGLDYSADQLRVARDRLPVVRADGRALPLARK